MMEDLDLLVDTNNQDSRFDLHILRICTHRAREFRCVYHAQPHTREQR